MTDRNIDLADVKSWAAAHNTGLHDIAKSLGVTYQQLWRNLTGKLPMPDDRRARLISLIGEHRATPTTADRLAIAIAALHHIRAAIDDTLERLDALEPKRGAAAGVPGAPASRGRHRGTRRRS